MVSTAQLEQIRAQRQASLTDVCRLDVATNDADARGGYTQEWDEGDDVACNFTTPSSSNSRAVGLIPDTTDERAWIVALPYGTSVKASDRIVRGGVTYEVLGVDRPGTFGVQQTCAVVER